MQKGKERFMPSRRDSFSGSLVGQCLGDALGFPVEGYMADVCRQYVAGILRSGRAGEVGRPPFAFGQYTDDSQLARELLISFRERGRFDPADYALRIAALFAEERVVGRGAATEAAAARLAAGVPWEEAGTPPPSAGNGSAMRAGPVGLLFHDDPQGLIRASVDQGRITHRDSRCSAGAVCIAGAVALCVEGGVIEPGSFLTRLREWAGSVDGSMADALGGLTEWIQLPPAKAVVLIGRAGRQGKPGREGRGITPFVIGSVLWSLYAFLRSPGDYWETVCMAISGGGDTDTTAAMAGAVSGAHLGLEAIPPLLSRKLTDRGAWGYDELVALAEQCFEMSAGG
jgi:ADP-ribosylglycohydrolase